MKRLLVLALVALSPFVQAGQPIERFRSAAQFTFCQGSIDQRYGNADATYKITMQVFILGQQVYTGPSYSAEAPYSKTPGTLDFTIKLSDFDPTLPPDTVNMIGTDLGNDQMQHITDSLLPGPYTIVGNYGGVDVNLTLRNVRVTALLKSQNSNNVVAPTVNPVLAKFCDVQFDDMNAGAGNNILAIPGSVSGWVVSPVFTVSSMRIEVNGIQQAGQVPAHLVPATSHRVVLGRQDAGNVASLSAVDADALRVCKFIVPNQQVAPVNVEVETTIPGSPQYLSLVAVSKMDTTGLFQQTLDMFDFAGSGFASGDARTDAVTTTYQTRKLDATGSLTRYQGSGDLYRARYRVRQTGPAASPSWCADHDQVAWIVTP